MAAVDKAYDKAEAEAMEADEIPTLGDWELWFDKVDDDSMEPTIINVTVFINQHNHRWSKSIYLDIFNQLEIVPKNYNNRFLFNAIRYSKGINVTKLNDNSFSYFYAQLFFHLQKGPWWKVLTGVEIILPLGLN